MDSAQLFHLAWKFRRAFFEQENIRALKSISNFKAFIFSFMNTFHSEPILNFNIRRIDL